MKQNETSHNSTQTMCDVYLWPNGPSTCWMVGLFLGDSFVHRYPTRRVSTVSVTDSDSESSSPILILGLTRSHPTLLSPTSSPKPLSPQIPLTHSATPSTPRGNNTRTCRCCYFLRYFGTRNPRYGARNTQTTRHLKLRGGRGPWAWTQRGGDTLDHTLFPRRCGGAWAIPILIFRWG